MRGRERERERGGKGRRERAVFLLVSAPEKHEPSLCGIGVDIKIIILKDSEPISKPSFDYVAPGVEK